ncbi:N4-gp56 family major capsid protein [Candidatus Contubernalis alkaliaceticus]|uniref:N4-gp56 family major capsid protein n=1 Tax=Candidatus Contubernalis alkaliaceticus TaxID=338645 RepID=UPI001F4C1A2E|nr:N4-gp56 family major capsid protein [Candidatus Contubernalis alkalaceticus]UNC92717.1 N4-gp56 family major capsid protein [Candidatus Contubernalis alkalaceticus]
MTTNTTHLSNLINPQVMADMIAAELPKKIRFAPLAEIDFTLQGQPGNTITLPKWVYIGDATVVGEGVNIDLTKLESDTDTATIVKVGKGVELTDECVLSGYGDPVGSAKDQLLKSISAGVDNACLAALDNAVFTYTVDEEDESWEDAIYAAADLFDDEDDEVKVLFVNTKMKSMIRRSLEFTKLKNMDSTPLMDGVFGEIGGCQVVASKKIALDADTNTYTCYIVKLDALSIFLKRNVMVEKERDIVAKLTVITADQHFVAHLKDDSKVVKVIVPAIDAGAGEGEGEGEGEAVGEGEGEGV